MNFLEVISMYHFPQVITSQIEISYESTHDSYLLILLSRKFPLDKVPLTCVGNIFMILDLCDLNFVIMLFLDPSH